MRVFVRYSRSSDVHSYSPESALYRINYLLQPPWVADFCLENYDAKLLGQISHVIYPCI